MCFFFSLIPATFWLVIAALFPIMGLVVTLGDLCPIADFVAKIHE